MTKAELEQLLEQVEETVSECLDPEMTREEIVARLKELAAALAEDEAAEEEDDEED